MVRELGCAALAGLVAAALVACAEQDDQPTKTVTVTKTEIATPTPDPEPRLEGTFVMQGTVIREEPSVFDTSRRFRRVWRFRPDCPVGSCDLELRRTLGVAGTIGVQLKKTGPKLYEGRKSYRTEYTCRGTPVDRALRYRDTVRVEIVETDITGGQERAVKVRGTVQARGVVDKGRCTGDTFDGDYDYEGELKR